MNEDVAEDFWMKVFLEEQQKNGSDAEQSIATADKALSALIKARAVILAMGG